MKQIVVISGKGGTGKTVISASLACLADGKVIADCDVDAPDLHLLLHPQIKEKHQFRSGQTAVINKDKCDECGKCVELCRFEAISPDFVVDPISCEGCKVCFYICPQKAVLMEDNLSGHWFISETKYGPLVHAKLGVAEENSGKLVATVRQKARAVAKRERLDYVIIDGPPGIGCPVIASLTGVDLALVVTEPTLSGVHDLERVLQVARHFRVRTAVVINKFDLNLENSQRIEDLCQKQNIEVIASLPFSVEVSEALVRSQPVVEYGDSDITQKIKLIWQRVLEKAV